MTTLLPFILAGLAGLAGLLVLVLVLRLVTSCRFRALRSPKQKDHPPGVGQWGPEPGASTPTEFYVDDKRLYRFTNKDLISWWYVATDLEEAKRIHIELATSLEDISMADYSVVLLATVRPDEILQFDLDDGQGAVKRSAALWVQVSPTGLLSTSDY